MADFRSAHVWPGPLLWGVMEIPEYDDTGQNWPGPSDEVPDLDDVNLDEVAGLDLDAIAGLDEQDAPMPDVIHSPSEIDGPWSRQLDGETSRAYACFCLYRDMGEGRSLDKAYQKDLEIQRAKDPEKKEYQKSNNRASGRWRHWSRHHNWVERARAWDDYLSALELQARRDEELKERATNRRHRRDVMKGLMAKSAQVLRAKPVEDWKPGDAIRAAQVAVQELRKEYDDEPAQKHAGADGGPIEIIVRRTRGK